MHQFYGAKHVLATPGSRPGTSSTRPGTSGSRPGTTSSSRPGTRGIQFRALPAVQVSDQSFGSSLQTQVLSARGESGARSSPHVWNLPEVKKKSGARSSPHAWGEAGDVKERASQLLQMAEILWKLGEEQKRHQDDPLPDERVKSFCDELLNIVAACQGEFGRNAKLRKGHLEEENFWLRRELAERNAKVAAHEHTFRVYMNERENGRRRNLFCRDIAVKARVELHDTTCAARVFGAWQTAIAKQRSYDRYYEVISRQLRADGFAAKSETMMRGLGYKGGVVVTSCFSRWAVATLASKEKSLNALLDSVEQQVEMMNNARARSLAIFEKTINRHWNQIVFTYFFSWVDERVAGKKRWIDQRAQEKKRELRREIITARVMRNVSGGEQVVKAMVMAAWLQLTETNKDLGVERRRLRRMADIGRTVVLRLRAWNLIKLSFVRWYLWTNS